MAHYNEAYPDIDPEETMKVVRVLYCPLERLLLEFFLIQNFKGIVIKIYPQSLLLIIGEKEKTTGCQNERERTLCQSYGQSLTG